MAEKGKRLTLEFIREIREVVKRELARYRNTDGPRGRWFNAKKDKQKRSYIGELTEDLNSGSTALFQRKVHNGTSLVNYGDPVAVRTEWEFTGGPIPSGTEGAVELKDKLWWLIRANWCPEAS